MRKARLRHPVVRWALCLMLPGSLAMFIWWVLVFPHLFNGGWIEMFGGIAGAITLTVIYAVGAWNTLLDALESAKSKTTMNS